METNPKPMKLTEWPLGCSCGAIQTQWEERLCSNENCNGHQGTGGKQKPFKDGMKLGCVVDRGLGCWKKGHDAEQLGAYHESGWPTSGSLRGAPHCVRRWPDSHPRSLLGDSILGHSLCWSSNTSRTFFVLLNLWLSPSPSSSTPECPYSPGEILFILHTLLYPEELLL